MDSDDLDRWLDEDRSAGPPRTDPTARPHDGPGRGDRRSHVVLALAAVLGVVGLGVLLLGSSDEDTVAGPEPVTAGTVDQLMAPADVAPVTTQAPAAPEVPTTAPVDVGGLAPAALTAGAVAALRERLTVPGDAPSYLEWATPVDWRPLEEGVSIVVLDAIWLDGQDGDLSTARRGRWGVVLGDDGVSLATPWQVSGPPETTPVQDAPPTGTTRLQDVTVAAQQAGWRDVSALASDPHPLLTGIVVALIEGVPPGGEDRQTTVVWLQDGLQGAADRGLSLLGASS